MTDETFEAVRDATMPILKNLKTAADEIRAGRTLDPEELVSLLERAQENLDLSLRSNFELMRMVTRQMVDGNGPRVIALTKDDYLRFCRHMLRADQSFGDYTLIRAAMKTINNEMDVKTVSAIEDGPEIVRHLQSMEILIPNWVKSLTEFMGR